MTMELHPLCAAFPEMSAEDLADLRASMKTVGLRLPIILCGGKILDGRHRYQICSEENIRPRFEEFSGPGTPLDFVVALNMRRRSLSVAQKIEIMAGLIEITEADAAARQVANLKQNVTEVATLPPLGKTRDRVAKAVGTSPRTAQKALTLRKEAPERWQKVVAGEATISGAAKQLAAPDADEAFLRHVADLTGSTIAQGRERLRRGGLLSGIEGLTRTSLDCAEELSALADIQEHNPKAATELIRRAKRGEPVSAIAAMLGADWDTKAFRSAYPDFDFTPEPADSAVANEQNYARAVFRHALKLMNALRVQDLELTGFHHLAKQVEDAIRLFEKRDALTLITPHDCERSAQSCLSKREKAERLTARRERKA